MDPIIKELTDEIELLEKDKKANARIIDALTPLKRNLIDYKDKYIWTLFDVSKSKEIAISQFIEGITPSIERAKAHLESEIGWGDRLCNMLISFINELISLSNTALGQSFEFFSQKKAPMIPQVEQLEKTIQEKISPSIESNLMKTQKPKQSFFGNFETKQDSYMNVTKNSDGSSEVECPEEFGFEPGQVMRAKPGVIITETMLKKVGQDLRKTPISLLKELFNSVI
ncbi:hypothetical protein [Legionella waltersii]|uniref:Substrate of the Dot/Icm secretion system n=1 Tax=Legionella waltersii TaxID=66969 RepID=A0A0W1ANP7_9GAMM|nr:hypothetical protein [Legionella waltersii]KTD82971.1 substrate of the Dot/Icm secretion system [Legionella waltersii]SNU97246.1 Chaperone protein DnaJ 1 [Legionella waltersii]